MHIPRTLAPIAAALTLLLVLAACQSGGGATDAADPTTAATEMATHEASAGESAGGGASGADTVTIADFSFGDDITVAAGTTVAFANEDSAAHTVTEGTEGAAADGARFDEEVAAGESVDITFDEPGTYEITCKIHPDMQMTVTVEG